jgi:hypothetical protein
MWLLCSHGESFSAEIHSDEKSEIVIVQKVTFVSCTQRSLIARMNKSDTIEVVLRKRTAASKLGIQVVNRNDSVCIFAVTSKSAKRKLSPSMKVRQVNGESVDSALQVATILRDSPAGKITIVVEKLIDPKGPSDIEQPNTLNTLPLKEAPHSRPPHSRSSKMTAFRRTNSSVSDFFSNSYKSVRHVVRKRMRRKDRVRKKKQDGVVSSDEQHKIDLHVKEKKVYQKDGVLSSDGEDEPEEYSKGESAKDEKIKPRKSLSFKLTHSEEKEPSSGSESLTLSAKTRRRDAFRHIVQASSVQASSASTIGSLIEEQFDDPISMPVQFAASMGSDEMNRFVKSTRIKDWVKNFRRSDPRYQILHFFNDVAQVGTNNMETTFNPILASPLLRAFYRASVFTVWRPTSFDAIRRMMLHEGVGKGLDIKGKSAKKGKLSGFVPFLQIHKEEHKKEIRTRPKDGRIRVFYKTKAGRDHAVGKLNEILKEMMDTVERAEKIVADGNADEETTEWALEKLIWRMTDPSIHILDDYAPNTSGMDVPERLFWEGIVKRRDISRVPNSENDTGRPSEPNFQNMNNVSLRRKPTNGGPKTVLMYYTDPNDKNANPMNPLNFVMAYEEDNRVMPVVSDFDCFLIGTRGVEYKEPLAEDQLKVLKWCVKQIECVLENGKQAASWTSRWLNILKTEAAKGFHPEIPPLGFSDPKSNTIMKHAIHRLNKEGSVRHGAECFNFYFPQELDDYFLVISDDLSGTTLPWKYVDPKGLQEILNEKIDLGYAFPINPKWILCDNGWKEVYDKLMASQKSNVQDALRMWYPPESGIREKIEAINYLYPDGFQRMDDQATETDHDHDGTAAMDLAEQELRYYLTFQRAKRKLRGMLIWKRILDEHRNSKKKEAAEAIQEKGAKGDKGKEAVDLPGGEDSKVGVVSVES